MKVSDCLVACLEEEDVEYVFGVPGEENEDLLFSLDDSEVEFVPTRHEGGAAFIADVWGRVTGEAGVCLATLGPGATNLMTGVADANLDKAPLVAITGQGDLERLHQESHQMIDVVDMFESITKWNSAISDPSITSEVVRKAFKLAEAEKPGATHIELSEDVAKKDSDVESITPREVRRPSADEQALDEAMELLAEAEKPLIIAGNGAIRSRCARELRTLVEQFDIPVAHTFMGKGAVDDRSEQSLFALGLGFRDYVMDAVDEADLILTVGYDIAEYAPESWNPNKNKTIVHIDFEPAEVYTHYQPEVEIVCDSPGVLQQITNRLTAREVEFDTEWYKPVREEIKHDIETYDLNAGDKPTIPGVINVLREAMDSNSVLISDVGSHKMWIARNFKTCCPGGCIISNGLASMGIALPGGIAASLADPERTVVSAMGDGGFMMNSQELETARRVGANYTNVVFRDDDFGLISWKQSMSKGRAVSTEFNNPDIKEYAESFGINSYRLGDPQTIKDQLPEIVNSGELSVVEIPISTHVNDELTSKLEQHPNGGLIQ